MEKKDIDFILRNVENEIAGMKERIVIMEDEIYILRHLKEFE